MTRRLLSILAVPAMCAMAGPALAASAVTSMVDHLSASPVRYVGQCPGVITFNGTITVNGRIDPSAPVEIGYQFTRSDGATGPNQFFNITAPGTYPVSTTWTLGGPSLPTFTGWEKFKAWPTGHQGGFGYSYSNEAHFSLNCQRARPPVPGRP